MELIYNCVIFVSLSCLESIGLQRVWIGCNSKLQCCTSEKDWVYVGGELASKLKGYPSPSYDKVSHENSNPLHALHYMKLVDKVVIQKGKNIYELTHLSCIGSQV